MANKLVRPSSPSWYQEMNLAAERNQSRPTLLISSGTISLGDMMKPALVLLALVALLVVGDFIFSRGEGTHALVVGLSQLAHKRMVE